MIIFWIIGWLTFSHTLLPTRVFTCIKRKKKLNLEKIQITINQKWSILSAHRGGSYERTENTLTAFKHAISQGSNLLECDVNLTKDGVVLVSHDPSLTRICGVDEMIQNVNY